MLQRITTWLGHNLAPRTASAWGGFRLRIKAFYQNHPRFGGGIVIFVMILLLLGDCYLWSLLPAQPGSKANELLNIPYGAPLREVGQILRNKGLIRSELSFELYTRISLRPHQLKAGYYQLNAGMSLPRIVKILENGECQAVRITIPEGYNYRQIADLLVAKGLVKRERFLEILADREFINQNLGDYRVDAWPEGYLFPDTYNFSLGASEAEIIGTMLRRFRHVFKTNFGTINPDAVRKIVIIASLVEKEARQADERPIIARVFYNRLRLSYPLQSCATVQYALGARKEKLLYSDLKVQSPYNTYLHYGLPPGPIANPGLASLKAAVDPAKVNYLYFVAKSNGTHVFSTSYQQHLDAQKQIQKSYWFQ